MVIFKSFPSERFLIQRLKFKYDLHNLSKQELESSLQNKAEEGFGINSLFKSLSPNL